MLGNDVVRLDKDDGENDGIEDTDESDTHHDPGGDEHDLSTGTTVNKHDCEQTPLSTNTTVNKHCKLSTNTTVKSTNTMICQRYVF